MSADSLAKRSHPPGIPPRGASYTRPGVFMETSYISIGDPYQDGRTASGPPSGVCGSVTSRTGESKAVYFPPRLCWGGAPPGVMTRRTSGIDADTWRSRSRKTLPSPGRSKLLNTTGLLNGQRDRSPRLPAVWSPSSPAKSGKGQRSYFSIPRWEQDAYALKEEHASAVRKKHAANIKQGPFYTDGETKSYATRKINTAVPPRQPRRYDPFMQ